MKPNLAYLNRRCAMAMLLALSCGLPVAAVAAVTSIANEPLASKNSDGTEQAAVPVKPNIAFILDDSNSMDAEIMPADKGTSAADVCFGWHKYNGLFYNPALTYKPPYKIGGTVYSDGVPRFPDATFTAALDDGFFALGGSTFGGSNTSNSAKNLTVPANLTAGFACPSVAKATIKSDGAFENGRCYRASSVSVVIASTTYWLLGTNTASAPPAGQDCADTPEELLEAITTGINNATASNGGFTANYINNTKITIFAPSAMGNVTATPSMTVTQENTETAAVTGNDGLTSSSPTAFGGGGVACASGVTGKFYYSTHKTDPSNSSCENDDQYNTVTDANNIAAPSVTTGSAAAKTNYANWFSYYRARSHLIRTAIGEAFKDVDQSKYRVGLFFINSTNSGGGLANSDLKIDDFSGSAETSHRGAWYKKLYEHRKDGGTPLLGALSRAGRMFAGKITGFDPVQYSCQQNFAIMATDGYWNDMGAVANYGPYGLYDHPDPPTDADKVGNADQMIVTTSSSAKAKLQIGDYSGGGSTNGCWVITSIKHAAGGTELLNAIPACATTKNGVGNNTVAQINAGTANHGYTANYNNGNQRIIITAPASLGALTTTPVFITYKGTPPSTPGTGKNLAITVFVPFENGETAGAGAPRPYGDKKNFSNSLSDVAYYYYMNDLRTDALGNCINTIGSTTYTDLCENNVRGAGKDSNSAQHMTTFTIGMGVTGTIPYESNYETAVNTAATQYVDIVGGTADWRKPNSSAKKIDDLWHAAVNGRGYYYNANNSADLARGLKEALSGIQARLGSSSAAATSSQEPVENDNFSYTALYRTVKWDGDLQAKTIDTVTGELSSGVSWSAQAKLDAKVVASEALLPTPLDGRNIKFFSSGEATKLQAFTYANLPGSLQSHFSSICDKSPAIDQCGTNDNDLTDAQKTVANNGTNLVDYLRGRSTYEDEANNATVANRLYRGREHVLGDIVNAVPAYARNPQSNYDATDSTYGTFKTTHAARAATVFIAANDGMLHAINAVSGDERWAYVPSMVMPNMWKLADRNYGANHLYSVDGSPTVADICDTPKTGDLQKCTADSNWKTILVGGLNKGGCGYYALDITNPTNPKGLWEFTNENLGLSYGNPVITKNKAGKWVVIFTSGYNNVPGNGCGNTGDGNGHVFVVDANTGALLDNGSGVTLGYGDIPTFTDTGATLGTTPAGTTATPSGLGKLNVWQDDPKLGIAQRVYGGDLLGNVWRIDFDNNYSPAAVASPSTSGKEAVRLAQLKDADGKAQPITIQPHLTEVTASGTKYPVVVVGTGRYLGIGDISDTSRQSVYALKDELGSSGISDVRATLAARTLIETIGSIGSKYAGQPIRKITGDDINWAGDDGWYFDLSPGSGAGVSPGERVNVDMQLQLNMLNFAGNVPYVSACNVGGYAYLYSIDVNTGKNMSTATDGIAGRRLPGNAMVAGLKTVKLASGTGRVLTTATDGTITSEEIPDWGLSSSTAKRTTWREITD